MISPKIPIFVLSLRDATEKRQAISEQMAARGLSFEFENAPDGRHEDIPRSASSQLTSPEAACALGHRRIYQRFLALSDEWLVVLEDDVQLAENFSQILYDLKKNFLAEIEDCATVILLGGQEGIRSHFYFVGKMLTKFSNQTILASFKSNRYLFRTCCYLLNRAAATNLAESNVDLLYRADDWHAFGASGAIENYLLLRPGIAAHPIDLKRSTIQNARSNQPDRSRTLTQRIISIWQILGRLTQHFWNRAQLLLVEK